MQQVVLFEVSQSPETALSVMTLKVKPLVDEITGGHSNEEKRCRCPGARNYPCYQPVHNGKRNAQEQACKYSIRRCRILMMRHMHLVKEFAA